MSDDKKPFLTVDYSKAEKSEELKSKQESCNHGVYGVIDTSTFDGTYRKVKLVDFYCEICGKEFAKEVKVKKKGK